MAHFAKLDDNNTVVAVIVIPNSSMINRSGEEDETVGVNFCQKNVESGIWVQTSYNGKFRGKFAGIGMTYDPLTDEFVSLQPEFVLPEGFVPPEETIVE